MRRYGWEDFALPLMVVFAVTFALTLRHQINVPVPVSPALAEGSVQPDYVITVTAKRLPAECRGAGAHAPSCDRILAGETRMEMRENNTRLAERASQGIYAY
jgi:hypothetical protein